MKYANWYLSIALIFITMQVCFAADENIEPNEIQSEPNGVTLSGILTYNGRPISEITDVRPFLRNPPEANFVDYNNLTGRFILENFPLRQVWLRFEYRIANGYKAMAGDFTGESNIYVDMLSENEAANLTVPVEKVIHITSPIDNAGIVETDVPGGRFCPEYINGFYFEWDPVVDACSYDILITINHQPEDNKMVIAKTDCVRENYYLVELPDSEPNEFYWAEIFAFNENGNKIAHLSLTYDACDANAYANSYPFRIVSREKDKGKLDLPRHEVMEPNYSESDYVKASGILKYNGIPMSEITDIEPVFSSRLADGNNIGNNTEAYLADYDNSTGRFIIEDLPRSYVALIFDYHVTGQGTMLPGNYRGVLQVDISKLTEQEAENLEVPMRTSIHTTSPFDNNTIDAAFRYTDNYPEHSSPVSFEWKPLKGAVEYNVLIKLFRGNTHPEGFGQIKEIALISTRDNYYLAKLPESEPNELYWVEMMAYNQSKEIIGFYNHNYENGNVGSYRFRVVPKSD